MDVKSLSIELAYAIDQASIELFPDEDRKHLGASQIGHDCPRYLCYVFRWMGQDAPTTPRMRRLFSRGHHEEPRFQTLLRKIGLELVPPPEGEDQHRISDVNGHFGGSCDDIALTHKIDRNKYPKLATMLPATVLCEYKTCSTGKSFNDYDKTIIIHKPIYYAQSCVYGYKRNLNVELFFVVNKNDDDIKTEVIELDLVYGKRLVDKAATIINCEQLPPKLSTSPSLSVCKFCNMRDLCHFDREPVINCRSCRQSRPVENKQWLCKAYNTIIPEDFIATGCERWEKFT